MNAEFGSHGLPPDFRPSLDRLEIAGIRVEVGKISLGLSDEALEHPGSIGLGLLGALNLGGVYRGGDAGMTEQNVPLLVCCLFRVAGPDRGFAGT
jgi:hypothetical protein